MSVEYEKAPCAQISKQFAKDYIDCDRRYDYGGYKYDGPFRRLAENSFRISPLKAGDMGLNIRCAKEFLIPDFLDALADLGVAGLNNSEYVVADACRTSNRFCTSARPPNSLIRTRRSARYHGCHRGGGWILLPKQPGWRNVTVILCAGKMRCGAMKKFDSSRRATKLIIMAQCWTSRNIEIDVITCLRTKAQVLLAIHSNCKSWRVVCSSRTDSVRYCVELALPTSASSCDLLRIL